MNRTIARETALPGGHINPNAEIVLRAQATGVPVIGRRSTPGSTAFVPPAAGLIFAGQVVWDLVFCQNVE